MNAVPLYGPADTAPISVVITCHNLGRYLGEAIESVRSQTLSPVELVVVDDGSTDKATDRILRYLKASDATVIRQSQQGVAAARNLGIQRSHGRYICCLDADDRLLPAYLERATAILESDAEVGLVPCFFLRFGDTFEEVRNEICAFPGLLVENAAAVSSVFRRTAWERVGGYFTGFSSPGIEDWDLWISILETGFRAHVIPEVLFEYRVRPGQMSETFHDPASFAGLIGQLVIRHRETYTRYLAEVIAAHSARWIKMSNWTIEQRQASAWVEAQRLVWLQAATERQASIDVQTQRIAELEGTRQ